MAEVQNVIRGGAGQRWLLLAAVSTGLVMVALDMSVLYTALPTLTQELHATSSEKLWIINAYPLVVAGLLLATGTLGDRIGHKKMFLAGLAIFGAGSAVAALALSPAALIGGRALLGVGAATMMPASLALVRLAFDDERERNLAIAVWGSTSVIGAALGPVVGGVLLEYFWWGSVFIINVPIVLVALVAAARLAPSSDGNPDKPWDLVASAQVMAGLVGTVYAIKELAEPGRSLSAVWIAVAVAAIGFASFVARQRRQPHPLLDFSIFRNPLVATGVIGAGAAMFTLAGVQFVATQRFQLVDGFDPLEAGVLVTALAGGTLLGTVPGGAMLHAVGFRALISGGFALATVGVLGALLAAGAGIGWTVAGLLVTGAGVGLVMAVASTAVVTSVPHHRAGMASSVDAVSYELGSLTAVAVLGSILAAVYTSTIELPHGAPAAAADSPEIAHAVSENGQGPAGEALRHAAQAAFENGYVLVLLVTLGVVAAASIATGYLLRPCSRRDRARGARAGADRREQPSVAHAVSRAH